MKEIDEGFTYTKQHHQKPGQMAEKVLTKFKYVQIWKNLLSGFMDLNFALKLFSLKSFTA